MERLYKENGTKDHSELWDLVLEGKLVNPDYFEYIPKYYHARNDANSSGESIYYPAMPSSTSFISSLMNEGYAPGVTSVNSWAAYALQARVASANGYDQDTYDWAGHNTTLNTLLQNGELKNPDVAGCDLDDGRYNYYYLQIKDTSGLEWGLAGIGITYTDALAVRIANVNGYSITTITDTIKTALKNKLKAGTLVNPDWDGESYGPTPEGYDIDDRCFPAYTGEATTLSAALQEMGVSNYSTIQSDIAPLYGLTYVAPATSTLQQDYLLTLLKEGRLLNPNHINSCDSCSSPNAFPDVYYPVITVSGSWGDTLSSFGLPFYSDSTFKTSLYSVNNTTDPYDIIDYMNSGTLKAVNYSSSISYTCTKDTNIKTPGDSGNTDEEVTPSEPATNHPLHDLLITAGVTSEEVTKQLIMDIAKANGLNDYTYTESSTDEDNLKLVKLFNNGKLVREDYDPYYSEHADTQTEHLLPYGYLAYTDYQTSTQKTVTYSGKKLVFSHWSFDSDGETIVSTNLRYDYRITNNTTLYAIYKSEATTIKGLSVSNSGIEILKDSKTGTPMTRLNTVMNPYNMNDDDTRINQTAVIYVIAEDNSDTTENFKITTEAIKNLRKEIYTVLTSETSSTFDGKFAISSQIDGIKGSNYFVYLDPNLTNKNRMQFMLSFTTSKLANKRILAFAAMNFNFAPISATESEAEYDWIVSDNCIDYSFNASGVCINSASVNEVSGNTSNSGGTTTDPDTTEPTTPTEPSTGTDEELVARYYPYDSSMTYTSIDDYFINEVGVTYESLEKRILAQYGLETPEFIEVNTRYGLIDDDPSTDDSKATIGVYGAALVRIQQKFHLYKLLTAGKLLNPDHTEKCGCAPHVLTTDKIYLHKLVGGDRTFPDSTYIFGTNNALLPPGVLNAVGIKAYLLGAESNITMEYGPYTTTEEFYQAAVDCDTTDELVSTAQFNGYGSAATTDVENWTWEAQKDIPNPDYNADVGICERE